MSDIYGEGYDAYPNHPNCPYPEGSWKALEWRRGWDEAKATIWVFYGGK